MTTNPNEVATTDRSSLCEKFLTLARRVKKEGRDDIYYLRCADIGYRLDNNLPVGNYRRRRRRSARGKGNS